MRPLVQLHHHRLLCLKVILILTNILRKQNGSVRLDRYVPPENMADDPILDVLQ